MFAEERQRVIVRHAQDDGRVDVGALAAEFGVALETIRRDLSTLERHGLLRRVHGGAIPVERLPFEPDLERRAETMAGEKERIAKAALREVPVEGAIYVEGGSTPAQLAELLPADRELTVVTSSLPIAMMLVRRPRFTVVTLGGRVRARTLAEVDDLALRALAALRVDVAFLGTNAMSLEHGLSTPDPAEAAVKRAALRVGLRRVLLADHTKYGNDSLLSYGTFEDVDALVTDSGFSEEVAEELRSRGLDVVLA